MNSITKPGADIDAEAAWDINTGRNDVIIAVCDGGVDYNHPDLDPGDRSRVIAGYDAADNDNDPLDDLIPWAAGSFAGHGTSVAGVIGAITNNNSQVAGVMQNCKIMPVKMVGSGGITITFPFGSIDWDFSTTAFPSDVADAVDYAVNNGAHVINLSYGFADMGWIINEVFLRVPLLYAAINNAYENNVVVVVAMGNEYKKGNPTNYPAAFAHDVIAVGATNQNSLHDDDYSSSGSHINISAPGTGIWTTERFGGIGAHSGTSMAAPIVSGVAGLIISQGLDRNFNLTNDDVRHILEITSDDITGSGIGFDEETGHGKVNARKALELLDEPNIVVKGTSLGGNTSITNLSEWITIIDRWGLAPGTYYNVDQYEITKHITFETPFCDIPTVWLRDRESVSMSFGSPNDGFPYAEITNITETGFDVRYASYFVRFNSLGQTINKYIPALPNSTKIEYTAVGFGVDITAVTLSSNGIICSSGSTVTASNCPSGSTVSWTTSSNLTVQSGGSTSNPRIKAINSFVSGTGTVQIHFTSNGCTIDGPELDVWVGKPSMPTTRPSGYPTIQLGEYESLYISLRSSSGASGNTTDWWCTGNIEITQSVASGCTIEPTGIGIGNFYLTTENSCGTSPTGGGTINVTAGGGGGELGPMLLVFPNPATESFEIQLDDSIAISDDKEIESELRIYDQYNSLKEIRKFKGKKHKIYTSRLSKGLYLVEVVNEYGKFTTKVIVNK